MASIQLQGKIFIIGEIEAVTGLHIGGSAGELDIGGVDNPVIRNPLTHQPYIPGSSLRGKIRSLLDRYHGRELNQRISQVRIHQCKTLDAYKDCPICPVFGIAANRPFEGLMPTRLIVRDALLTVEAKERFDKIDTDMPYTEVKTEVAIDRITSAATPRPTERVPAEATFGPLEMVYSLYTLNSDSAESVNREISLLDAVLTGMVLLEDDYLGGSGSRGSGKIAFRDLEMTFKSRKHYEDPQTVPIAPLADGDGVAALQEADYQNRILEAIQA
jgi:CRISPR-associated protein Csm3